MVGRVKIVLFLLVVMISSGAFITSLDRSNPPVFLIVSESTRADHIGPCYGYNRTTAPNTCELAEDGVLYSKAYSTGSHTSMALPSLLTGLPPNSVGFGTWKEFAYRKELSSKAFTVAESARENGYETYTNIGNNDLAWEGLRQGFGNTEVKTLNRSFSGGEFYFLRFTDVHFPYAPDEEFRKWDNLSLNQSELSEYGRQRKPLNLTDQQLIDLYDGEIYSFDSSIGRFIDQLKRQNLYEDSLIIITGDHGEAFGEDGNYYHSDEPYSYETHVPLIVKYPGNKYAGQKIEKPVSWLDIPTTLFNLFDSDVQTFGDDLRMVYEENYPAVSARTPEEDWIIRTEEGSLMVQNLNQSCKKTQTDLSAEKRMMRDQLCRTFNWGNEHYYPPEIPDLENVSKPEPY